MSFNPRELYKQRKQKNRETFAPYLRYVGQSGLLLVIAFLGIVFVDQYIKLIRNVPESFPYEIVITLVMSALIMYTPYRTWLKPADIIYLMPKQVEMKKYFNYCRTRSYVLSFLPLLIGVFLAHFVLNAYDADYTSSVLTRFIILKVVAFYALYTINELQSKVLVIMFKLLTLATLIIGTYSSIVNYEKIEVFLLAFIPLAVIAFYVQKQTSQFTNWQQMIAEEQKKVHRTYRFLNLFVDVPHIQSSTKKRSYLAVFADRIRFKRANTFAYLHYLTFARSEVGGIFVRNMIVGGIISYVMATTMLWNGFAALLFAVIFMGMNAVQLSTLRQLHQHSVWQNIYPIPLNEQHKQMTAIEIRLLIVSSLILIVVPSIPILLLGNKEIVSYFIIAFVVMIVWRLIVIRSIVKKKLK